MIESYQYIYYLSYAAICAATVVTYVKVQSTEGMVITTKEFNNFRNNFLKGYIATLFVELLSVASFYHILTDLELSLEQITDLYAVTVVSSAIFGVVMEVVDIGSRKNKCVLTALLFGISFLTLYSGGNYHLLLLGRVIYGIASVLLHSVFDSYIVHENATVGYPDEWLMQTFSFLAHCMAFVSAASGGLGQAIASISGPTGCVTVAVLLSFGVAGFISVTWSADIGGSRFMCTGFMQLCNQTVQTIRSNRTMLNLVLLSACYESCITIFTFFWAPWMADAVKGEDHTVPYELVFSVLATSSMLGNYIYGLLAPEWGHDSLFQMVLAVSSGAFFLGSVFQTPSFILFISIAIQCCVGFYWPGVGFLRGKFTMPEFRSSIVIIIRIITTLIVVPMLELIHHKPTVMLLSCAILSMGALYFHTQLQQSDFKLDSGNHNDDDDDVENNSDNE